VEEILCGAGKKKPCIGMRNEVEKFVYITEHIKRDILRLEFKKEMNLLIINFNHSTYTPKKLIDALNVSVKDFYESHRILEFIYLLRDLKVITKDEIKISRLEQIASEQNKYFTIDCYLNRFYLDNKVSKWDTILTPFYSNLPLV
jgi:hypothetical protein